MRALRSPRTTGRFDYILIVVQKRGLTGVPLSRLPRLQKCSVSDSEFHTIADRQHGRDACDSCGQSVYFRREARPLRGQQNGRAMAGPPQGTWSTGTWSAPSAQSPMGRYGNTGMGLHRKGGATFFNEFADLQEGRGRTWQDVARGIGLDNQIGYKFMHPGPGWAVPVSPRAVAIIKTAYDHAVSLRIVEAMVAVNDQRKRAMAARRIALTLMRPTRAPAAPRWPRSRAARAARPAG